MPREGSRRAPRTNALGLVALVAAFCLAVLVARIPILTPDVWWHLATGRIIASAGVPHTDPFSYTLTGQPWLAHEWLADRILYAVYMHFGLLGVVWWRAAWIVAATVVSYALARRHAAPAIALPLVVVAAYALQRNWIDRPQLWTFVLMPAVVYGLEMVRQGVRRAAVALPLVFALWVNVHGGFMLGLVVVALWLGSIAWEGRATRGAWRLPVAILAACALATLLNPNGWAGAVYPLHYVATGLRDTIQEEKPGRLDSTYAWVHLGLVLAFAASAVRRWRVTPLAHRLAGGLLALLSLPRVGEWSVPFAAERHAPLFLLAGVPLLAWQLAPMVPVAWRTRSATWTRVLGSAPAWIAVSVLGLFVTWQVARAAPRDGTPAARLLPGRFPEAGARWLRDHRLPPHLLNPYRWGGFLLHRLSPPYQVWIDSRGDLYGAERLREEELLYRFRPGSVTAVQQLLAHWDPDVIVWYFFTIDFGAMQVHPFTRWLLHNPEWRLVFVDPPEYAGAPSGTTAIFLRVQPRNARWLSELPAVQLPPNLLQ